MGTPPGVIALTQQVSPPQLLRFDKYILVRKLAEGGMAEIFLAKQVGAEGFERDVVIKLMLGHLTSSREFVDMFLDEARLAAKLHHPNIVQISDLGFTEGRYFICMEYLAGEDLQSIFEAQERQQRPVPLPIACKLILSACEGLEFAHAYAEGGTPVGLVHRDVSPSNIIVTYQGIVKVLDFGIAKASSKLTQTQPGLLKGKWGYMSPEQARGDPLDARSDLFSLGITFHELLTGRRVFEKEHEIGVLLALMQQPIPSPSALRPEIPPELDRIVMRALEKRADDRYPDAGAMRADLEQFLATGGSLPGMTQLAHFMTSVFGRERATIRTQVPTLKDLTRGAPIPQLAPVAPPAERAGVEKTYVRSMATPSGEHPAPSADSGRGAWVQSAEKPPPPVAERQPARRSSGAGALVAVFIVLLLGAAGASAYYLQLLPALHAAPPPVAIVPPPPPPPTDPIKDEPQETAGQEDPPVGSSTATQKTAPPRERREKPIQLTIDEVKATMKRPNVQVRACFDRHRPSLPEGAGRVEVNLSIANSGTVREARVVTSGLESGPLAGCVTKVLRGVKFPRNTNDPPMSFTVPYSYSSK